MKKEDIKLTELMRVIRFLKQQDNLHVDFIIDDSVSADFTSALNRKHSKDKITILFHYDFVELFDGKNLDNYKRDDALSLLKEMYKNLSKEGELINDLFFTFKDKVGFISKEIEREYYEDGDKFPSYELVNINGVDVKISIREFYAFGFNNE